MYILTSVCALQTPGQNMLLQHFCAKKLKKQEIWCKIWKKKICKFAAECWLRVFSSYFQLFSQKVEKAYFDQRLEHWAPKGWSKYTTKNMLLNSLPLFLNLKYIELMLGRTGGFGDFKRYVINEVLPVYIRLGFVNRDNDTFMDISLRELVSAV